MDTSTSLNDCVDSLSHGLVRLSLEIDLMMKALGDHYPEGAEVKARHDVVESLVLRAQETLEEAQTFWERLVPQILPKNASGRDLTAGGKEG